MEQQTNMKTKNTLLFLLLVLLLAGCADVTNVDACANTEPYGFFSGLWHGMVVGFAFIGSLFSDDIAIYAVNNTGGWYDFGFILGAGVLTYGSSKARKR